MEFLVHIEVDWPSDADPQELSRLISAERERAAGLTAAGTIRRLWRVPGQWANWGLWEAADATELHDAICSLPLYPWLSVNVIPLARHPSDPQTDGGPE